MTFSAPVTVIALTVTTPIFWITSGERGLTEKVFLILIMTGYGFIIKTVF